ncbi:MAG: hypothetical protein WCO05_01295 [Candidatus Moraniibacteriota bacterium]|jgi:photosystem II stability/assembly factor-like uncharacterized protein
MKKGAIRLICSLFVLVLTGCSLPSGSPAPGTAKKYVFSKSISISKDGGRIWVDSISASNKPRVSDINPLSLVFDPGNENIAYVGLLSGGIMKTSNGGEAWEFLALNTEKIYGLAIDPTDSKIVYASTVVKGRGKIFKNAASGAADSWKEIYTAASNGPLVIYLAIDRRNANTLYVSTSDNQVVKTVDGGESWRSIFQPKSPVTKIALDSKNSNLIYLLTKNGDVFSSSNGGDEFKSVSVKIATTGQTGSGFSVVESDPSNTSWVYLAGNIGIIRSKDAGANWEVLVTLNNPKNSPVGALAINPQNSREIIYGASQATYKSIDDGKTWSTSQFDLPKAVNILEYNPLNPNIVYAGFRGK